MNNDTVDIRVAVFTGVVVTLLLLFSITGPVVVPFSGVVSKSMEPAIEKGDFIVISSLGNPNPLIDTSIQTVDGGGGGPFSDINGSVIAFETPSEPSPVLHRVHMKVDQGDNWVEMANESFIPKQRRCDTVSQCPAPYDGYITKGDSNEYYDQATGIQIVSSDQIYGKAIIKIPNAGFISVTVNEWEKESPAR